MRSYTINLVIALIAFSFCGCGGSQGSNSNQESTQTKQTPKLNAEGLEMHPKYDNIPLADLGITVVNPQGWTDDQMNFHINYCMQMMGSVEEIDPLKFCDCFLTKIQYYYEPKFFKEAYDDQKTWNGHCFVGAQL